MITDHDDVPVMHGRWRTSLCAVCGEPCSTHLSWGRGIAEKVGGNAQDYVATTEEHFQWRYLPRGCVVHALSTSHAAMAQCGVGPWYSWNWQGTGSQLEYERAATLPKCKPCLRAIAGLR